MDDLTTVCYFFDNSPKRQQYFELLINVYGEKLNLNETNRRYIIGLSKTRWVERYRAYENYYLLHKSVIATFESVLMPHLYNEFYAYLEDKFEEKWTWDADAKTKAQGLYAACSSFAHIVAFSVFFNGLEPLKPLVVKLQKRNQDIFKGYYMINTIVSDLMDYRRNVDKEFSIWYGFAVEMANSIDVEPSTPRIAKCWSNYRDNVDHDSTESYYKRSMAVSFLDDIISQIRDQTKDRSHVEIFRLLPSVMFAKDCSIEESCEILLTKFENEMFDEGLHFRHELKMWYKMWEQEITKCNKNWQDTAAAKPAKRVDGKEQYQINPPDGLLETISLADYDFFPNIKKLLVIGSISPIGSTEAERAASGVRRLKTPFRSTMGEQRESDLNLLLLQRVKDIDIDKVVVSFIKKNPRR